MEQEDDVGQRTKRVRQKERYNTILHEVAEGKNSHYTEGEILAGKLGRNLEKDEEAARDAARKRAHEAG